MHQVTHRSATSLMGCSIKLGVLLASCLGCSGASLDASVSSAKKDNKPTSTTEQATAYSPENEKASEPAMVSGAFLTCVEVESPSGQDSADAGCVIKADAKMVDITHLNAITWSVRDDSDQMVPLPFRDATAGGIYHVMVSVPKASMSRNIVKITITSAGGLSDSLTAPITMLPSPVVVPTVGAATPAAAAAKVLTFGQGTDFQIGDNTVNPAKNADCASRLDKVSLSGPGMRYPIVINAASATVTIALTDLCGLRQASSNRVRIKSGAVSRFDQAIAANATRFDIPRTTLAQGTYYIEVESLHNRSRSGRDDFIIGGISVTTSDDVSIGTPAPFN